MSVLLGHRNQGDLDWTQRGNLSAPLREGCLFTTLHQVEVGNLYPFQLLSSFYSPALFL